MSNTPSGWVGARHFAAQNLDGNDFVFRARREAVNTGQIDELDFASRSVANISQVMFDGHAGEVGDLLAEPSQAIEQRGFAGIRRSNDGNRAEAFFGRGRFRDRRGRRDRGQCHCYCTERERARTTMRLETSRRRATSMPSTR